MPFSLGDLRGRKVLVGFAYGHCVDVCPLVVHELQAARKAAAVPGVAIVIVTLDPWRDAPARLPGLAASWNLPASDRALSGSVQDVEAALDAFKVARSRDEATGNIAHGTTSVVIDRDGRIRARVPLDRDVTAAVLRQLQ